MTEKLGYEKYVAQGGDWGSAISTWLGLDHSKNCRGIHINMLPARHIDGPKTEEERSWDSNLVKIMSLKADILLYKAPNLKHSAMR